MRTCPQWRNHRLAGLGRLAYWRTPTPRYPTPPECRNRSGRTLTSPTRGYHRNTWPNRPDTASTLLKVYAKCVGGERAALRSDRCSAERQCEQHGDRPDFRSHSAQTPVEARLQPYTTGHQTGQAAISGAPENAAWPAGLLVGAEGVGFEPTRNITAPSSFQESDHLPLDLGANWSVPVLRHTFRRPCVWAGLRPPDRGHSATKVDGCRAPVLVAARMPHDRPAGTARYRPRLLIRHLLRKLLGDLESPRALRRCCPLTSRRPCAVVDS